MPNNNLAIEIENIHKSFRLYHEKNRTLKGTILRGRKTNFEEFTALKNISFRIYRGETIGIIGENGSGKSTLLKLLANIIRPGKGQIKVEGRVSALLELGAGFHPELTGRDNIYLNGSILGLSNKEITEKYDRIVSFAELEHFIDIPIKNYSSGMYMRLGFAIAINVDPDILIIDEVLAVGDQSFQAKCFEKINEFKRNKKTIILVSHDLDAINNVCDRAILLDKGIILADGKSEKVIQDYRALIEERKQGSESDQIPDQSERFGTKDAEILSIALFNSNNEKIKKVHSGEKAEIRIDIKVNKKLESPIFGMIIRSEDGLYIYDTNTFWQGIKTGSFEAGDLIQVSFDQNIHLMRGKYFVSPAIAYSDAKRFCDWWTNALIFRVDDKNDAHGRVNLSSNIKFNKISRKN